ncbi:MAG: SEC-C domain-containing protein [Lachnospiraceae bacterium]|nr:SEC-C domain-containing protein [Lachnospiraceae bacterium]
MHHKNGDMEADSIYINVYHNDARKDKGLYPDNRNFVCFVDYNISGNTTLVCGGLPSAIWSRLYHEKTGLLDIAWREAKYIVRRVNKIGANSPCPCGSGKKYKKCCRGKGIYD